MLITSQSLRTAVLFCCLAAMPAIAQDTTVETPSTGPANLAYVEGVVDLVHEGVSERAEPPVLLLEGDVLRTRSGRAEIVFADGTLVHLDRDAELEILAPKRLRLLNGRLLIRVATSAARAYYIDTPAAIVRFDSRGEYGVAASLQRGDLEVTVSRGVAEIDDGTERAVVRAGEMLTLATRGTSPTLQPFNTARLDTFAQWSNQRTHDLWAAQSAAQLPTELRPYAPVLDENGRWDHVEPYGNVWFPSVSVGWRPYYDGWWDHTRYGWTWHGRDRWAWPTHHFGRWGFTGSHWYWIPANVWGPAWVSWGFAPGYVSWSPLGWDGYPAVGFGGSIAYGRRHHNPWRSWTVVPRDHFGRRRLVRAHAIDGGQLDERTRGAWMVRNTPPASPPGFAVSRGTTTQPGATGSARRQTPNADRAGSVRRPSAATRGGSAASSGETSAAPPAAARRGSPGSSGETPAVAQDAAVRRAPAQRTAPVAPDAPVAPGYVARPGTDRGGDTDSRRGRSRAPDPLYVPAPPPPEAAPPPETSAQPREAERSAPPPYTRGGVRSAPAGESDRGSGDRGGSARGAVPRGEPRAQSPRSEGGRESGGARQRGGSVGAPSQGAPAQSAPPPSGGAVRRRPGA